MPRNQRPAAKAKKPAQEPRLSRHRRPVELPVADWQVALRQQFGREQAFRLQNLGADPVFSHFSVTHPIGRSRYTVTIRGLAPGANRCTCLDYATNHLGTCKHIEFTLATLARKHGGKRALVLATPAEATDTRAAAASAAVPDPWPALLQAGASLPQGLAPARAGRSGQGIRIEPDPQTGQPSLRLPLPDAALMQPLAQAFAPWLR